MAQGGTPKYTEGERCPLYAMSAQAFMQRATHAQRRIVCMEERAARFRDMATRITGGLQTAHVQGAQGGSRVEDGMTAFMDICRDIEEEAQRLEERLGVQDEGYERVEQQQWMGWVFEQVTPQERLLLEKRFMERLGQRETAKALGVSQMQVSRMERRILARLRELTDRWAAPV